MLNRLSTRMLIWLLIVFTSVAAFFNIFLPRCIEKQIADQKISVLYKEAQTIGTEYMTNYYQNYIDLSSLTTQLKTVDTFIDSRIWAVNADGKIIADTRSSEQSVPIDNLNVTDPEFLSKNYVINTTIQGTLSEPSLSVIYTISSGLTIKGYIVMLLPMKSIEEATKGYISTINYCLVLFGILLILAFFFLYHYVNRPLRKLKNGVKEYMDGNFGYQLDFHRHDEFYTVSSAINYMAQKLENLEDYQKNFIANISHDFRSPLTSIRGYTQAILDGTIPPEMQNKYLNIILFETDRLTKLTTNLLTLNNIKYNGAFLNIVTFPINSVIKKTAETFEGIGTKKKISIELIFAESEIPVCGDVDKIQQVLYNLIDNAIKFSPNGSTIRISTEEKNDKVFVSVKDHGIGIPNENIQKIWDRFYKTDLSRGKDKKGTGLGLSIVKEIINAHGENINVISTEGVGTEFVFTLPAADNE